MVELFWGILVKKQISVVFASLFILCLSPLIFAQNGITRLTIFSNNLGLVEEERTIELKGGINEITLGAVSKKIILDSVQAKAEGCKFLEQECSSDFLLSWKIYSEKEEKVQLRVVYLTTGLNWDLRYQLVINEEATFMNIHSWAKVENKTGINFSQIYLSLTTQLPLLTNKKLVSSESLSESPLTASSSLLDISYSLPYPVTIGTDEEKRLLLFSRENIPIKKVSLFDGEKYGEEVREELWFVNISEEGPGIPLPEGEVYIYQTDSEKRMIFLGEAHLPEIPLGEIGKIYLGTAKKLRGERVLIYMNPTESYKDEQNHKVILNEYSYKIILHNYGQIPVMVKVIEHFYGELEKLESNPLPYARKKGIIIYEIEVPPAGEKEIQYKAKTKSVGLADNTTN